MKNELILFAAPLFLLLMGAEIYAFRVDRRRSRAAGAGGREPVGCAPANPTRAMVGYEPRDSATSLTMGAGSLVVGAGWKLIVVALMTALYEITPLRIPSDAAWGWALLLFAEDLSYYAYHRASHEIRVLWASHVVHHSSRHFNLSTALRQTWVPVTTIPFWLWLALLGFAPWMILLQQAISLIYQFWIHTERIDKLPRPIELVFNTPSHHRVHHGANRQYLDRNYGGILIIWDRLFGSFEPEGERVAYGLTKNIETYNPLRVAFGEYQALFDDVRRATGWRDRLGHVIRGPAWRPSSPPVPAPAAA